MNLSPNVATLLPRRSITYGNWTRPKSPGLLGLGAIGTGVLFVGAGITIVVAINPTTVNNRSDYDDEQ